MASVEFGGRKSDPVAGFGGEERLNTPKEEEEEEEERVVPEREDWSKSSRSSNESMAHWQGSRTEQL